MKTYLWLCLAVILPLYGTLLEADEELTHSEIGFSTTLDRLNRPAVSNPAFMSPNNAGSGAVGNDVVSVKVIDVRNISGTNPTYQSEPILNYDGETVPNVDTLVDEVQGISNPGGYVPTFTCRGNVVRQSSTYGANFFFGYADNECDIALLEIGIQNSSGLERVFDVENPLVSEGVAADRVRLVVPSEAGYTVEVPPSGATPLGASSWAVRPGANSLVFRHLVSGKRWRLELELIGEGPPANSRNFYEAGFEVTGLTEL